MVTINTNGKLEYSYFCSEVTENRILDWRKNFKDFLNEHVENIILEVFPKRKVANFLFSTIPSERRDISPQKRSCDTLFVGVDVNYKSGEGRKDLDFFLKSLNFVIKNSYQELGGIFDGFFTEGKLNELTKESIRTSITFEWVQEKLKAIGNSIDSVLDNCGSVIDIPDNVCVSKSVDGNRSNFLATIQKALYEETCDKFVFIITPMSVNKEKVSGFFNRDSKEIEKVLILSNTNTEQKYEFPKNSSGPVIAVLVLLLVGVLGICLSDSKSHRLEEPYPMVSTLSKDSLKTISNDSSLSQIEMLKQQLKDSTIKYQYQPLLMEYDSVSNSIMIIRSDSTRSMFFSLE